MFKFFNYFRFVYFLMFLFHLFIFFISFEVVLIAMPLRKHMPTKQDDVMSTQCIPPNVRRTNNVGATIRQDKSLEVSPPMKKDALAPSREVSKTT